MITDTVIEKRIYMQVWVVEFKYSNGRIGCPKEIIDIHHGIN
jgi:hypothetical protein